MRIAFLSIAVLILAALTASSSEAGGGFDWYGDDDGDGWNNATELRYGWMQNPLNPWDFSRMPCSTGFGSPLVKRHGSVSGGDTMQTWCAIPGPSHTPILTLLHSR